MMNQKKMKMIQKISNALSAAAAAVVETAKAGASPQMDNDELIAMGKGIEDPKEGGEVNE